MISLKDLGDEQAQDFWVSFETPEQAAERKKHEELLAEGKSEHDVKHRCAAVLLGLMLKAVCAAAKAARHQVHVQSRLLKHTNKGQHGVS